MGPPKVLEFMRNLRYFILNAGWWRLENNAQIWLDYHVLKYKTSVFLELLINSWKGEEIAIIIFFNKTVASSLLTRSRI